MTRALRVEKEVRTVRVLLVDGSTMTVSIYVARGAGGAGRGQTAVEALLDAEGALPCRDVEGDFVIIGANAICGISTADPDFGYEGFFIRHQARVRLEGGHDLSGTLLREAGRGERLTDAFRLSDGWIPMEVDEHLLWLRVDRVIWTREVDPEPS